MQEKYEEIMQEVEKEISAINLNGKHIIKDCKAIIVFLRDKLTGLKADIQSILSVTMPKKLLSSKTTNRCFWGD